MSSKHPVGMPDISRWLGIRQAIEGEVKNPILMNKAGYIQILLAQLNFIMVVYRHFQFLFSYDYGLLIYILMQKTDLKYSDGFF